MQVLYAQCYLLLELNKLHIYGKYLISDEKNSIYCKLTKGVVQCFSR